MLVLVLGHGLLSWRPGSASTFVCMFEHEKLQVYQLTRELNREIARLTRIASKGNYDHIDQTVRCGGSMGRNIAEASGEWSPKEKAKFYRYAKRSGAECAARLDILVDYNMLREEDTVYAKELLERIIAMLVRLIHRFEGGAPGRPSKRETPSPSTSTRTDPNFPARARNP